MGKEILLKMENISKEFPGVKALQDVNLEVFKGEVHVLLGENGAGKSTLMKILNGVYRKDKGKIYFRGKEVEINSPQDAQRLGISIVYQELNLIPHLSVAENVFIGREPLLLPGVINWKKLYQDTLDALGFLGTYIDPRIQARKLSVAQQQMVEIARAVSTQAELIIMDEPTSSLTEKEINELFRVIKVLTGKGISIIYISHRLEEVEQIGHSATVLRDGRYVGTVSFSEAKVNLDQLIRMMVGRELKEKFPKEASKPKEELLTVKGLNRKGLLEDINFSLYKGEILGIAGLVGAGRTELVRAIFGADPVDSGEIYLSRQKTRIKCPRDAIELGIGFLTEDRKKQGLFLKLSVKENITLAALEKLTRLGFIKQKREQKISEDYIKQLGIKTPSLRQKVQFLSGGNQQKVVLAKWLATRAKVIIFDEPTRGVDVGAKVEIYKLMNELIKKDTGIIMISSEMPEILGMSDRILVMHEGRITGELSREEATQEKIMLFATGSKK